MTIVQSSLLLLLLTVGGSAWADTKLAVMHTRLQSKFGTLAIGNAIDEQLAALGQRAGYTVVDTAFPLDELACREIDCLPGIAERHGLQALAFVEISYDKIMTSDVVRVSLYRVDASVRTEVARCPDCDEAKARQLVEVVGLRLLQSEPGTPSNAPALLPPESPPPTPVATHRAAFLALGALSAVGLAGSVVAIAVEGSRNGACVAHGAVDGACTQKRDTTGPMVGAALTGVVFLALTPTFFVLARREEKRALVTAAYLVPSFDQNGVGLVAGGRF